MEEKTSVTETTFVVITHAAVFIHCCNNGYLLLVIAISNFVRNGITAVTTENFIVFGGCIKTVK
jgi:hypothetical protein